MTNLNVLPMPKQATVTEKWTTVECKYFCEQDIKAILEYIDLALEVKPSFTTEKDAKIIAKISTEIKGYSITCKRGKITILAQDLQHLHYAFATLVLSAKPSKKKGCIKCRELEILDYSDTDWRGLSLDVCRRFHPIKYLYKVVDLCWLYKINKLQIHFTDDENYTLPSKVLPNLSTKDNYYTFNEIQAFIEYAKSREIDIIPEIDMPGHTIQFMKKYPKIFGKGEILKLTDGVFNKLYRLIDELLALFCHSSYIHLGGDEAKYKEWETCKDTQKYIKDNGLKNEQEAYAYFVKKVTDYVLSKGKTPIVWEGFNKNFNHLISKDVIVIAWESYYQLAPELLESGFKLINCSWKPLYIVTDRINWTYKEILKWNKYTWDHFWDASPASKQPIIVPKNSPILGAQVCAWGDVLVGFDSCEKASEKEFKLIVKNLPCLSQRCWYEDYDMSEDEFLKAFNYTEKVLNKII